MKVVKIMDLRYAENRIVEVASKVILGLNDVDFYWKMFILTTLVVSFSIALVSLLNVCHLCGLEDILRTK